MVVNYLQFCEIIFFLIFAGMIYNWWYLHTRCAWNNEARPRAGVASLSSFLHFLSALEREKLFKRFGILTLVTGKQTPNKKKNYSHITRKSLLATTPPLTDLEWAGSVKLHAVTSIAQGEMEKPKRSVTL